MTTQEIIESLRELAAMPDYVPIMEMRAAADRLEELKEKCNMHYETICELTRERNAARAEVAQLRDTVAAYEQATVKESLTVRPEPSRLEIAAMAMQGFIASSTWGITIADRSVDYADALIAAARKAK